MRTHSLQRRHNGRDCVSNHRRLDCVLNRLFRRRSKKTSKLHVTGLCEGNSLITGGFPAQRASVAENVPVWWRHHVTCFIIVGGWESDTDLRCTYLIFQCFTKCSRIKKALHMGGKSLLQHFVHCIYLFVWLSVWNKPSIRSSGCRYAGSGNDNVSGGCVCQWRQWKQQRW